MKFRTEILLIFLGRSSPHFTEAPVYSPIWTSRHTYTSSRSVRQSKLMSFSSKTSPGSPHLSAVKGREFAHVQNPWRVVRILIVLLHEIMRFIFRERVHSLSRSCVDSFVLQFTSPTFLPVIC
ncbi:hypothetical protein FB446DRAFT_519411 [Lentinula raphanica]|nr:hypothetical protein FB446DRAFT_519411 [Lentinula raphanica]